MNEMEATILNERAAFDNKFFRVIEREIKTKSGEVRKHLCWDQRGKTFSVAVPITEKGEVVMVLEPKYGSMEMTLNLPAGRVEKNEEPVAAADRELQEETGYAAEIWTPLRERIIEFPDKVAGGEHFFFLALDAKAVKAPEEKERQAALVPREEWIPLIMGTHPKLHVRRGFTIVGLSLALLSLNKQKLGT